MTDEIDFKVVRKFDKAVLLQTKRIGCIPPDRIIKDLIANGYVCYLNGKIYKP